MKESEEERQAVADTLYGAAVAFYGQGFKTDRKYWLALADDAILHLREQDNEG